MSSGTSYAAGGVKSTGQRECPFCGATVWSQACAKCYAPAEVINSILGRTAQHKYVGVVGPSGVGKTVYLGILLDLLAHGAGGLHGMAKGPFSLTLQRQVMLALERQRFPEKTPVEPDRWQWVHCDVTTGRKGGGFDLITPDVAGEAVAAELESPGTNQTIRALIARCAGLTVLVDTPALISEGQGQEIFAMQLVTYLEALHGVRGRKLDAPVALVFTKADLCKESIGEPEAFARSHASALFRMCEARLKHFRFFRSSVAGACGRLVDRMGGESLAPLRVEPRGIIEPFAWLSERLR
jgi:Double-GTPase 2